MFACVAKSEAETEVNCVDLKFLQWKEPTTIKKIRSSVLPHGEPSFLDLQEIWGVDGQGMALNTLFLVDFNMLSHLKLFLRL